MGEKRSIMDHFLVPRHEIVPPEEREELLKKWGVTPENLPKILQDDPVVKELGAKPGDLIRIYRKSPVGDSVYYRIVW